MAGIKAIFPHNCELEQFIFCMRLGQIERKDPVVTMKRKTAPLEFGLWHDTVINNIPTLRTSCLLDITFTPFAHQGSNSCERTQGASDERV